VPLEFNAVAERRAGRARDPAGDRQGQRHRHRRSPAATRSSSPNALGHRPIALLGGSTSSLRSNGINAEPDARRRGPPATRTNVNLIGGRTDSLIASSTPALASDGGDSLTINGTDFPDVFLLRSATADDGLAFVALINGPTPLLPARPIPVERIDYNLSVEELVVNGREGNDGFYVRRHALLDHDQRGRGRRLLQVGQLYKLAPHARAGRRRARGRASRRSRRRRAGSRTGISKPMTVNGGVGNDLFIVFHNVDTLSLFGDAGTTRSSSRRSRSPARRRTTAS
jgi:hypothetical protein